MQNLRINNDKIWKKIDKEDLDGNVGEFNSSSIYRPKKFKESSLDSLYSEEEKITKSNNNTNSEKSILKLIVIVAISICLIYMVYNIILK